MIQIGLVPLTIQIDIAFVVAGGKHQVMVGIPQAYDFYTQDPLGIPVLIVVVLFAATGSVIIYKMADIDVE